MLEKKLTWLGFAERIEKVYEAREYLDYEEFVHYIKQAIDDKKNGKLKNHKKKDPIERETMIFCALEAFVRFSETMNYEEALEKAGNEIGRSAKSVEAYIREYKDVVEQFKMIRDEETKLKAIPEEHEIN